MDRRVLHELQQHLEAGHVDFEPLDTNPDAYGGITKEDLEFAVAILGCKINRRLYRLPEAQREPSPHLFEIPTTVELLQNCAYFAQLQNKLRPTSATASMNLAWVATEKQEYFRNA